MKRFFHNKLFTISFLAALLAIALGVASVFSGGSASPVTVAVQAVLSPFQKAATAVVNGVSGIFGYFYEFDSLKAQNKELNDRIREMEKTVREAEQDKKENEKLREMVGIKQKHEDFALEMAEIISRNDDAWSKVLTIDKGSKSGIKAGDCVITSDGFAGYVSEVGPTWSEVTAVTDTNMSAGAMVTRTRDVMVCEGDFELMKKGQLRLSYVSNDAVLYAGDTVETSGLGGLFPKGIMIGTVSSIGVETHGVSKYAVITPFVDVDKLTTVFVVKSFDITD